VAEAARAMKLRHVVITAVARDDLQDGGAEHFAQTINAVRQLSPEIIIEVLTPDFLLRQPAIDCVLDARPHVFNHNMETVRRLTPTVRSRATYERSLALLDRVRQGAAYRLYTKSGLMLGLGESEEELETTMKDLREVGCDILTLGQYLQPTLKHLPVQEFVPPERFERYGDMARDLGFLHVASGPMVRSSYHADAFNASEAG
jgi:lipoic acid synthetase